MILNAGDAFPTVRVPGTINPDYVLDSAAGRYLVLAVLSHADPDQIAAATALAQRHKERFDDVDYCFFGLLPDHETWRGRVVDQLPGCRWLFDTRSVAVSLDVPIGQVRWILIDPTMRVLATAAPPEAEALMERLGDLPPPALHGGVPSAAPVLAVPRVFEPEFCRVLVEHFEGVGGRPSGFMREVDGVTRLFSNPHHKLRSDVLVEDERLIAEARVRIARRLAPQIRKAFQFAPTRIERYLVACYDAETGGHFGPHRDNTTKGTAHRRFAVSLNLNQDFDGGDLRFPEFGQDTFRPAPGGAIVFSCSLLHEATRVTRGRRYAFLPFLYDESGAELRARNVRFVDASG